MKEKKKGVDPEVSMAAGIMGRKGGKVSSPRKTDAVRKNAKLGGAKIKYSYQEENIGIMGNKTPIKVVIPDIVHKHPGKYQNQSFPVYKTNPAKIKDKNSAAYRGNKRYNAVVVSWDGKSIHLKRV